MTKIKSTMKEGVGYVKEEIGEMLGKKKIAREGRGLRNEGRTEKGERPKSSTPGKGKK